MPKFLTYQRPTAVAKQNWNHAPDRKAQLPIKAPAKDKPAPQPALPTLEQLLKKS